MIKHEVENPEDWSEWVCPDPDSYLMKCCDCGLVHEMQTRVAKYEPTPSEEFEVIKDVNMQAQFRMRRSIDGLGWLPEHKCGLHLSHNEHRDVYETIEEFYDAEDFISTEEWHKAVAEDSVWVLHWYPNTPIGFNRIAASTLTALEAKVREIDHG